MTITSSIKYPFFGNIAFLYRLNKLKELCLQVKDLFLGHTFLKKKHFFLNIIARSSLFPVTYFKTVVNHSNFSLCAHSVLIFYPCRVISKYCSYQLLSAGVASEAIKNIFRGLKSPKSLNRTLKLAAKLGISFSS